MKKKLSLIVMFLISLFTFSASVNAAKSGNYFTCGDAQYQCVSCTYKEATYYAKSDGKGNVDVSWETTDDRTIAKNGTAKHFCNSNECTSLVCPSNVYMYPEMKGNSSKNVYVIDSPNAQYQATINLDGSTDNKKPFLSESGGKYSPLKCQYYTYSYVQGNKDPQKSSHKNFVVSMDADGNFSITYDGNSINNASSLMGKGNITTEKFSSGSCPDIYASCYTDNGKTNCSASTEPPFYGSEDPSGEEEEKPTKPAQPDPVTPSDLFDLEQICDTTENPELVASFRLVGIFLNIIKIIVPIIIIIMGMFDMSKAVVEGKDDSIKKQLLSLFKRFIACVLIFFAPKILLGIFHFVDGWDSINSKYSVCINCIMGDSSCPEVGFGGQISSGVKSDDELVEETKKRARDSKNNNAKKESGNVPMEVPK